MNYCIDYVNDLRIQTYKKIFPMINFNTLKFAIGLFTIAFTFGLIYSSYVPSSDTVAFASKDENAQTKQQQSSSSSPRPQQTQPNINAKSIYDTGTVVLGNNVKNLIILIPDEAHHGNGEAKENRFIVHSFLPETAVVNKGTQVIWFSGDVNHEHEIIINDNKELFDSGLMEHNTASNPMIFNSLGEYSYKSPNIDQEAVQKGFVMDGKVVVIDQPNTLQSEVNSSNNSGDNNIDTVGVYMVPAKDIDKYTQDFKDKGFSIDSTYTFNDVRGEARGTNSQQSLLVWTAGPGMTLDNIISSLKEITPQLPYK